MLRSMYAGISGMKNFQTKLDVIGNNIANVNTSGFKKGRVTFQDMMSQTTSGAQGPTANRGGVNPYQVGLGSQLGSIDNIHTQGFRQTTNRPLDLALEGDGMFVVAGNTGRPGAAITAAETRLAAAKATLTRAQATLTTVQATLTTAQTTLATAEADSAAAVAAREAAVAAQAAATDAATAANQAEIDADQAKIDADALFQPATDKLAAAEAKLAGAGGNATIIAEANEEIRLATEELAEVNKKIKAAEDAQQAATDDIAAAAAAQASATADFNATVADVTATGVRVTAATAVVTTAQGRVTAAEAVVTTATAPYKAADAALKAVLNWEVNLDTSNVSYTRAGNFYLDTDGAIVSPEGLYLLGFGAGANEFSTINIPDDAQSFSIQSDGVVNYIDADGNPQVAGQVALANFSNAAGLQKAGSNLFLQSPNSGNPTFSVAETEGTASMVAGSLEMSNVDLAEEFTEMIVAQRGFQANTRIISTSDEILQELVNLKR